ncbi:uncharacterized protein B0I36DRAFT_343027 [Microdochium trichocladiopsis]|uniref:Uncharacterized protein n=1 Tax=Microdochium trichocladiopsis TaxID=1682393 RepID=A0A9P8XPI4_9PEZI|nr:uncharacterized protein B0I36DRAFT_343027 [Microdochium trichocladiopsis]KAH7009149.1 hypothetical protein B0I36DRAFT_343027 [Microdochium trichocladiopsis]
MNPDSPLLDSHDDLVFGSAHLACPGSLLGETLRFKLANKAKRKGLPRMPEYEHRRRSSPGNRQPVRFAGASGKKCNQLFSCTSSSCTNVGFYCGIQNGKHYKLDDKTSRPAHRSRNSRAAIARAEEAMQRKKRRATAVELDPCSTNCRGCNADTIGVWDIKENGIMPGIAEQLCTR